MGSVQGFTKCPKCNFNSLFFDDYYKSGEIYMMCKVCGFAYESEISNRDSYVEGEEWKPEYKEEETQGGGCYSFMPTEGIGSVGVLNPKEGSCLEFEKWILEEHEKTPFSKATYTYEEDGVWFSKDILTQTSTPIKPEDFDEY